MLGTGMVTCEKWLGRSWRELEEHPDNVAPCVLGSIGGALDSRASSPQVRMEIDSHYGVAVVVPDFLLPTVEARRVLPMSYTRADAVFNVQRSALLITALTSGSTNAFPEALEDQPSAVSISLGAGIGGSDEIARTGVAGLRAQRRRSVHSGVL